MRDGPFKEGANVGHHRFRALTELLSEGLVEVTEELVIFKWYRATERLLIEDR